MVRQRRIVGEASESVGQGREQVERAVFTMEIVGGCRNKQAEGTLSASSGVKWLT
jgi:hypothetical protein